MVRNKNCHKCSQLLDVCLFSVFSYQSLHNFISLLILISLRDMGLLENHRI